MTILSYVSAEADLTVGYVYKWTNLVNGMMYIGKHCGNNPNYIGSGVAFKAAVKEYGIKNFQREILYVGMHFAKVEEEILFVINARQSPNFYNDLNAWSDGMLGKNHTQESRIKISIGTTGRVVSEETRLKIGSKHKGRPKSVQQREKQRASKLGYKHAEDVKARIGASHLGQTRSPVAKLRMSRANHKRYHTNHSILKPGCGWCEGTLTIPDDDCTST